MVSAGLEEEIVIPPPDISVDPPEPDVKEPVDEIVV